MTERYTAIDGDIIEYPAPSPEVAEFLRRAIAATNDPTVSEAALTEFLYGRDNPILDQTVFTGRGAVTSAVFADPIYRVITDLVAQKQRLEGTFVEARDFAGYTLTVTEAAARIGISEDGARKAIRARRLPAIKRGASYWVDPRDADVYRTRVRPRGEPRGGSKASAESGPALRVRCGSVEGKSLRIKAPGSMVTGKHQALVDLDVPMFARAAIATAGKRLQHVMIIEPGDDVERIEWGPLFVEGRFRIVETIKSGSPEAWKAFEPS